MNRLHFHNFNNRRVGKDKPEERKEEDPGKAGKEDKAAERHVDSWGKDGAGGRWTRIHRTARRALFTPFKVAGGPGIKVPLKKLRITRGKFIASNKTFKIIDDWSVRANSHRMLEGSWIGTTDFREASEFIEDDSDDEDVNPIAHEDSKNSEEEEEEANSRKEERQTQEPERYGIHTPEETRTSDNKDPVCRRLFAASRAAARDNQHHPSDSAHRRQSEGECEDGIGRPALIARIGGHSGGVGGARAHPRAPTSSQERKGPAPFSQILGGDNTLAW